MSSNVPQQEEEDPSAWIRVLPASQQNHRSSSSNPSCIRRSISDFTSILWILWYHSCSCRCKKRRRRNRAEGRRSASRRAASWSVTWPWTVHVKCPLLKTACVRRNRRTATGSSITSSTLPIRPSRPSSTSVAARAHVVPVFLAQLIPLLELSGRSARPVEYSQPTGSHRKIRLETKSGRILPLIYGTKHDRT